MHAGVDGNSRGPKHVGAGKQEAGRGQPESGMEDDDQHVAANGKAAPAGKPPEVAESGD